MKKFILMTTLGVFLAMGFSACQPAVETPESVVERFLNLMAEDDIDAAMELGTAETVEILEQWKTEGFNLYKDNVITDVDCEETEEDHAQCRFMADGHEAMIEAVKVDGEWRVYMEK